MNGPAPKLANPWRVLEQLAAKARQAQTPQELLFLMANDSFALLPYRSALVLTVEGGRCRLAVASGLAFIDRTGPYGSWVEKVVAHLRPRLGAQHVFGVQDLPPELAGPWAEYWPDLVHLHPVRGRDGAELAVVAYLSDHVWPDSAGALLATLHQVHGLCLQALRDGRRGWAQALQRLARGRRYLLAGLALAVAAMFIPMQQFIIAPAEVVSLDATVVTAPVEGIVAEMVARPNQPVKKGQVLVRLDDTAIRNRLESARQSLGVARADFLAGAHRAFAAPERAGESGVLKGRIQERLAEVAFLNEQLGLLEIRASRDGVAVYGQANDWIGRPVSPGQRIMELADDRQLGVTVWVPVADSINLSRGAPVNVLLYADPLNPITATIEEASYQAVKSPDGVAAYRVRAQLGPDVQVRLGLRGSAKITGERVFLGYFLFRRPIAAARQWLGV